MDKKSRICLKRVLLFDKSGFPQHLMLSNTELLITQALLISRKQESVFLMHQLLCLFRSVYRLGCLQEVSPFLRMCISGVVLDTKLEHWNKIC